LVTSQPELLMRRHVSSWSCQPGQPANLAEVVWSPAEAALSLRSALIGPFTADLNRREQR
jgi:hypothetical protein